MKSRAYDRGVMPHDFDGGLTAEVHFVDGRSVQISCEDNGRVLIRLWGPNGTVEYGGGNMTVLSLVVELHETATIQSMYMNGPVPYRKDSN